MINIHCIILLFLKKHGQLNNDNDKMYGDV